MRFPPAFLDEIRARLPVSEVVGRRVRLKKQGREWAGLSPFNKEKTPSFFVNDQKGFYHCFSSGKHGDVFDFMMEVEGMPFGEAVERLAEMAGLPLPRSSPAAEQRERRRASLGELTEQAARFFQAELAGRSGEKARSYLVRRGIAPETIARFRLGYAPAERSALKRHFAAKSAPVGDLVEAGLLIGGEDIADPYDRFRDRVIFPIEDGRGRVIAFGGRTLDPDAPAKYLNSPETPLFHKGANLYNQHRARAAAHLAGTVVLVEGYVDAIALAQAGIEHVVAPLGTALTPEQLDLLWRLAPEPILCFDGDAAGRRAAGRAIDLALPKLEAGRSLRFAFLPEGQDPDDLVRAGGREAIDSVLGGARPLSEVLIAREAELSPLDTPERKAAFEARLRALVAGIADETVRRHYLVAVEEKLRTMIGGAGLPARLTGPRGGFAGRRPAGPGRGRDLAFLRPAAAEPSASLRRSPLLSGARTPYAPREAAILLAAINHLDLLDRYCEELDALEFGSGDLDALRRTALHAVAHGAADSAELRRAVAAAGLGPFLDRLEASVRARREWWTLPEAAPTDAEIGFRHALALHVKARALHNELRSAEAALAREPSDDNLRRVVEVQRSLQAVEGSEAAIDGFGGASGRPVRTL